MAAFGEQVEVLAPAVHGRADQLLAVEIAFGSVDHIEARVNRTVEQLSTVSASPLLVTDLRPTEPQDGYVHVRLAKAAFFHDTALVRVMSLTGGCDTPPLESGQRVGGTAIIGGAGERGYTDPCSCRLRLCSCLQSRKRQFTRHGCCQVMRCRPNSTTLFTIVRPSKWRPPPLARFSSAACAARNTGRRSWKPRPMSAPTIAFPCLEGTHAAHGNAVRTARTCLCLFHLRHAPDAQPRLRRRPGCVAAGRGAAGRLANQTIRPRSAARGMRITAADNGRDLTGNSLYLLDDPDYQPTVVRSTRVGVDYAGDWKDALLRFLDANSAAVSKKA